MSQQLTIIEQNRRVDEQRHQDAAIASALRTMAARQADRENAEQRVQAELDRYLERSALWQTQPMPAQDAWPVPYPYPARSRPRPYVDPGLWPDPAASAMQSSRVNWSAVAAVGGTLAVLPYLIPVIMSAIAPAVAGLVMAATYAVGLGVAFFILRSVFRECWAAPQPKEKARRKIIVTVEVED